MSNYDNPFDSGDTNPFSNSAAAKGKSAPAPSYSNLGGQFSSGSFYNITSAPSAPVPLPHEASSTIDVKEEIPLGPSAQEMLKKEKELQAKEAALKKKEEEVRRREAALGIDHKNWPPFFPIIHHDIANDIPSHLQYIQRAAYWSWIGIMICLAYNIIAVTVSWVDGAVGGAAGFGNFIFAILYAALGIPLSYILWYRRLYLAMRKDGAISFAIFFLFYVIHCAFSIFAAVAPPIFFQGRSLTGVFATIELFVDSHLFVGIVFAIGAGLFVAESFLSIYVLQQVYAYFRGSGKANQFQGEVAMGAATGRF